MGYLANPKKTIDRSILAAPGFAKHGKCVRAYEELTMAWYYHGTRFAKLSTDDFLVERKAIVRAHDKVNSRCQRMERKR